MFGNLLNIPAYFGHPLEYLERKKTHRSNALAQGVARHVASELAGGRGFKTCGKLFTKGKAEESLHVIALLFLSLDLIKWI